MLLLPMVFSVLLLLVFLLPILLPVMFSVVLVPILLPVMFSVMFVPILLPAVLLLLPVVVLVLFLGGSQVAVAQSLTHNPLRKKRRGLYAKRWVSGR